jgi:hypothetical protein
MSKFYYTAIMRGVLELRTDGSIRIVGKANWFTLVFSASVFAMGSAGLGDPVFSIAVIGIILFIYSIQARRFRRVAEIASAHLRTRAA